MVHVRPVQGRFYMACLNDILQGLNLIQDHVDILAYLLVLFFDAVNRFFELVYVGFDRKIQLVQLTMAVLQERLLYQILR